MKCSKCGKEIPGEYRFCCFCGADLSERHCVRCGQTVVPDALFCCNCGHALLSEAASVVEPAGTVVPEVSASPVSDKKEVRPKPRAKIWMLAIALLTFALMVAAVIFWGNVVGYSKYRLAAIILSIVFQPFYVFTGILMKITKSRILGWSFALCSLLLLAVFVLVMVYVCDW